MSKPKKTLLRIGRAENCHHHWLLLIWFVYFAFFIAVEQIVTTDYWPSHIPLDDRIPFCEHFVLFYDLWFPMLAATTLYTLFWDVDAFRKFMAYIGVAFLSTTFVYLFWHNGQDLRPAEMPNHNLLTRMVFGLYAADTNTNVCPSLHVIGCFAVSFAVFDFKYYRKRWLRIGVVVLSVLVSVSTVFIKQHSALDILAAIPYSLLCYLIVYRLMFRKERKKA